METELTSRRLLRGTNCSLAQLFSGLGVGKGVGQWIYCRGRALWDCWCSGGGQTTPSKAQSENLWLVYTEITCSWKFKANTSTCRFGFFSALLSLPLPSVWSSPDTTSALAEFQSFFFCLFVCLLADPSEESRSCEVYIWAACTLMSRWPKQRRWDKRRRRVFKKKREERTERKKRKVTNRNKQRQQKKTSKTVKT